MSATTRFVISSRSLSCRPLYRSRALLPVSRFSTTTYTSDLVGKVQEAAETVNKKAGKAASKGIETMENVAEKVKSATGTAGSQAKNIARDAENEVHKSKDSAKSMAKDVHKKATN